MHTKILIFFILLLMPLVVYADEQVHPLPASQAFQFNLKKSDTDSLIADWKIAPGYYLYRHRFSFKILAPKNAILGSITLPAGIEKNDGILGEHYVYEGQLHISLPVINPEISNLKLLVSYQGCASYGFCYPPMTKEIVLAANSSDITISDYNDKQSDVSLNSSKVITTQDNASSMLAHDNMAWSLLAFFGFGILLTFTPCVLPMIPILSGIIIGQQKNSLHSRKGFWLALTYVLSMALTFAGAGIIVALLGSNVQAALQTPWILILFSLLFVLLALSLFGLYEIKLPNFLQEKISDLSQKQQTGNYVGVAIMGCLSTLIISPCVSAPLVGALAYIGKTGNTAFGGAALFALGLGMGAPLIIIGTSLGKWLPKAGRWMDSIKILFGILLLGVAINLISRIIPGNITLFLWACLIILSAVFLGALSWSIKTSIGKLGQAAGIILLLYGGTLIVGSALGNDNLMRPLAMAGTEPTHMNQISFTRIKTVDDLKQQLHLANQIGKPVLLDFYADWCVACKEMAKTTFTDPKVKKALSNFVLLQADVTANDTQDKLLEQHFNVIAPPTLIFFNKNGQELPDVRIVGETGPEKFLSIAREVR